MTLAGMGFRAKLFMSGRSQALRLPARFRLHGPEVEIERIGQALWVQPCADASQGLDDWLQAFYVDHLPLPEAFLAERTDAAPQQRDWS